MANREKQDMTAELAEGKILPLVFKLTIPAVIAQLITFLYNIVDRMYVARIEGSGMDALAALGIVLPITLIMQAFANLVGLGGAPRAGIKLGEGKADEANRIFHTAFCLLVLLGVVIGAMAVSTLFATVPVLNKVSTGFVIIITTVLVAGIAAYFCPIEEKKEAD